MHREGTKEEKRGNSGIISFECGKWTDGGRGSKGLAFWEGFLEIGAGSLFFRSPQAGSYVKIAGMMNESSASPERNAVTQKAHRRQAWWQIFFPLILGTAAALALGVWAIVATAQGGSASQSADAALIWLLMPVFVMGLVPLALFAGVVYGLFVLNRKLPAGMYKVQQAMVRVQDGVRSGADKLVEPVLRLKSKAAGLQALKRKRNQS